MSLTPIQNLDQSWSVHIQLLGIYTVHAIFITDSCRYVIRAIKIQRISTQDIFALHASQLIISKVCMNYHSHRHDLIMKQTGAIVARYLDSNPCEPDEIIHLVSTIYHSLLSAITRGDGSSEDSLRSKIRDSVKYDYIVCLEDGRRVHALKRHLMQHHGLTTAQYISKWKLPDNYPLVAQAYRDKRREIALKGGYGRRSAKRDVQAYAKA